MSELSPEDRMTDEQYANFLEEKSQLKREIEAVSSHTRREEGGNIIFSSEFSFVARKAMIARIVSELNAEQVQDQIEHACLEIELHSGLLRIAGYDFVGRKRDPQLEQCLTQGKEQLADTYQRLDNFVTFDPATPLKVRDEVTEGVIETIPHTLGSVLHFLQSHTTHHYWIIRQIAGQQGYDINQECFGYSPSTLSHMKQGVR